MTAIQWTDEVWNPTVGCTKVSAGCRSCYAKEIHDRRHKAHLEGKDVAVQYHVPFEQVQLKPERLRRPLSWRSPRRIFVNSVSDLFHEDVPDEFIESVFGVMAVAKQHTFQVLTKRPERMLKWFTALAGLEDRYTAVLREGERLGRISWDSRGPHAEKYLSSVTPSQVVNRREFPGWPLPNMHIGVSVEDQKAADQRIPLLLQTPAAVRFISAEPLLGPIDLGWSLSEDRIDGGDGAQHAIDWVIVGGESGSRARRCKVEWIEDLVAQCEFAGVPVFVKQLGKWIVGDHTEFLPQRWQLDDESVWVPGIVGEHNYQRPKNALAFGLSDSKGGTMEQWPERLRVRQFPEAR
jgi:protein gp37